MGLAGPQQIEALTAMAAEAMRQYQDAVSRLAEMPGIRVGCGAADRSRGYLRRVLCQAAQSAVKTNNSHFKAVFERLRPKLGYKRAIWAVARRIAVLIWKILHEGARYCEQGGPTAARAAKRRAQRMVQELRKLGYTVQITQTTDGTA